MSSEIQTVTPMMIQKMTDEARELSLRGDDVGYHEMMAKVSKSRKTLEHNTQDLLLNVNLTVTELAGLITEEGFPIKRNTLNEFLSDQGYQSRTITSTGYSYEPTEGTTLARLGKVHKNGEDRNSVFWSKRMVPIVLKLLPEQTIVEIPDTRDPSVLDNIMENFTDSGLGRDEGLWSRAQLYAEAREYFTSTKDFNSWLKTSQINRTIHDTENVVSKLLLISAYLTKEQFLSLGYSKASEFTRPSLWKNYPNNAKFLVEVGDRHTLRDIRCAISNVLTGARIYVQEEV